MGRSPHARKSLAPAVKATVQREFPRRWVALLFFALAFVLYGNTLGNDYALDDRIVITENVFTKAGLRGLAGIFGHDTFYGYFQKDKSLVSGGRYRPLSVATFAIEYEWAGLNPKLGHFVNVALYGLTGVLLFLLLTRLIGIGKRETWWWTAPFLITLLFMTHPLHTEVVANIKGRDEVLALLLGLLSFHALLSWHDTSGRTRAFHLAGGSACMLLSLLAKESTLPLLLIIPLGLWFFRKTSGARLAPAAAGLVAAAAVYVLMRFAYAGPVSIVETSQLLNDPFVGATPAQRVATVLKAFGIYLRLFLFPHPLTHDYYYNQVPVVDLGSPSALLPLLIALALGGLALRGIPRKSVVSFGLLFFGLTFVIVSNLFFSVGTTLAERFLYIPSIGLLMAMIASLKSALGRMKTTSGPMAGIIALLVAVAFSTKTIQRNPAWKDDDTLFLTDVNTSPNSCKLQTAVGGTLLEQAGKQSDPTVVQRLAEQAAAHLERAVWIYPGHDIAWFLLGNAYYKLGDARRGDARRCFERALEIDPEMAVAHRNLAVVASKLGDQRTALNSIRRYRGLNRGDDKAVRLEAEYLVALGQVDSAIAVCEEALHAQPDNSAALGMLGMIYGKHRQDFPKAVELLTRALALDSTDVTNYENLGLAQVMIGNPQAAIATFERGLARLGDTFNLDWNLGLVWRQLGELPKAEAYLEKANRLRGVGRQ